MMALAPTRDVDLVDPGTGGGNSGTLQKAQDAGDEPAFLVCRQSLIERHLAGEDLPQPGGKGNRYRGPPATAAAAGENRPDRKGQDEKGDQDNFQDH